MVTRMYVRRLLKGVHCTIDESVSVVEAVQKAKSEAYGIIFRDVQMPEIDGWEAAIRTRDDDASPSQRARIIAVTAGTLASDAWRLVGTITF